MSAWERLVEVDHAELSIVRAEVSAYLRSQGIGEGRVAEIIVALNELVANAIDQQPPEPVRVRAHRAVEATVLAVENVTTKDTLREPNDWVRPATLSPQGRGLAIVRHLADAIQVDTGGGWTRVTCTFDDEPFTRVGAPLSAR